MLGRPSSDGQVHRREPGVRAQEVEQEADRRARDHRDHQGHREGQPGRRGGVQATSNEPRETRPSDLRRHGIRCRRGRVGRGPTSSLHGNDRSDHGTQTDRDDDGHPKRFTDDAFGETRVHGYLRALRRAVPRAPPGGGGLLAHRGRVPGHGGRPHPRGAVHHARPVRGTDRSVGRPRLPVVR